MIERAISFLSSSLFTIRDPSTGSLSPDPDCYPKLVPYRIFWCSQYLRYQNRPIYDKLVENGSIMLRYMSGSTTLVGSKDYLDYSICKQNNWILLDPSGQPARWSSDPNSHYYNRYYLDVRKPAFREWAASQFANSFVGPFHGLALDNIILGSHALARFLWLSSSEKANWELSMIDLLAQTKKNLLSLSDPRLLFANHTAEYRESDFSHFPELILATSGLVSECPIQVKDSDPPEIFSGSDLDSCLAIHKLIVSHGVADWWMWYDKNTARRALSYLRSIDTPDSEFYLWAGQSKKPYEEYSEIWESKMLLADYENIVVEKQKELDKAKSDRDAYKERILSTSVLIRDVISETSATFEECELLV